MTKEYKWAYCLSQEQYDKLIRIINKVPGLKVYLDEHEDSDLANLLSTFKLEAQLEGRSTPGLRVNIEVLKERYGMFLKQYEESFRHSDTTKYDFNLYSVLTWNPKPKWAQNMDVHEIDYLDHFIPQVIGLAEYLHKNTDKQNLFDLVNDYQRELNAIGKNNPKVNFILETIKERFYRLMGDHQDSIHYVNHSHEIDDHKLIDQFITEAENEFFCINLEDDICSEFTNRYVNNSNPFVAGEFFQRFFRANKVDIALSFAKQAFSHIFSSPNMYWHNKESIYGCVNILNTLTTALGHEGLISLKGKNPKLMEVLLETLYLLLSRTIYWTDRETYVDEQYDETRLPINIQHKLRAYKLRSLLIENHGDLLVSNLSSVDVRMMILSDLMSAHYMAYANKVVGNDSVFKLDAIRVFHTTGLYKSSTIDDSSEKGLLMNDELAMAIHKKYKDGKYCLTENEISEFISHLRIYFRMQRKVALQSSLPIPYLKKDNFSPSYKQNYEQIRLYLQQNGIAFFYHVTEKDKIKSIIKYGGLLSSKRCMDEGIAMPVREDMAISRDIDARLGLEDYARLSFCKRLPKVDERMKEGAELVRLKVSIDVALFEETLFSDIEATHSNFNVGPSIDDLKKVNLLATKKEKLNPDDNDYLQSQAEVLVKGFIPMKYIINIKNPEILD